MWFYSLCACVSACGCVGALFTGVQHSDVIALSDRCLFLRLEREGNLLFACGGKGSATAKQRGQHLSIIECPL